MWEIFKMTENSEDYLYLMWIIFHIKFSVTVNIKNVSRLLKNISWMVKSRCSKKNAVFALYRPITQEVLKYIHIYLKLQIKCFR